MSRLAFFVTGTDTGVGKTFISCALLTAWANQGLSTLGLKPVAAGCETTDAGLRNEDALALQRAMTAELEYEQINPYALLQPVSPHIAAANEDRRITVSRVAALCRGAMLQRTDVTLVEGAGGWRVPLNERETLADLAQELALPVILVVGMRLGCINHALLSAEAIRRDGLHLAGWVANSVDPDMLEADAVFQTLANALGAPCLGRVPWRADGDWLKAAEALDVASLLK